MPPIVVDLVISALILVMGYALMSEGLWGAALMFFNVLFAGMIAFNFYEPLAAMLASNLDFLSGMADTLCLIGIFSVTVTLLRLTTETLGPMMVRFPSPVYHLGRIAFGFGGAFITMAILLLAFETAPVHTKVFGVVDHQYKPPFKLGIDREWLGFFQYSTGLIFATNGGGKDPLGEYGTAKVFDPKAEWLLHHFEARPYGEETLLAEESTASTAAGAGAEGGEAGAGGQPSAPGAPAGGARGEGRRGRDGANGPE